MGLHKWMAKCPSHQDNSPSLGIREGQDGRILLHCFAGCPLTSILRAISLRASDLFPGSLPSSAEARRFAQARAINKRFKLERRQADRAVHERCRRLEVVSAALATRLARMPDGTEGDAVAALYHQSLSKLRDAEAARGAAQ